MLDLKKVVARNKWFLPLVGAPVLLTTVYETVIASESLSSKVVVIYQPVALDALADRWFRMSTAKIFLFLRSCVLLPLSGI